MALHHKTCVNIGLEFGFGNQGLATRIAPGEALAILERQRRACFADRHRQVAASLTTYYRSQLAREGKSGAPVQAIFARRFEYVWERMLQVALGHESILSGHFKGHYYRAGSRVGAGLDLRPDLLVRTRWQGENALMVLDAKDYDYDSWPRSADIGKQILYRLLVSERLRKQGLALDAIGNAFLFPARNHEGSPVATVGCHELDVPSLAALGRVVGLNLDFEAVARAYLASRVDGRLLKLVTKQVMPRFASPAPRP